MKVNISYAGVMTTYACNAKCAHCLYCSGPEAKSGFMTSEMAEDISKFLHAMGVRSKHIGGGEPFIDVKSLAETVRALRKYDVDIDYIETNAFWFTDAARAGAHRRTGRAYHGFARPIPCAVCRAGKAP